MRSKKAETEIQKFLLPVKKFNQQNVQNNFLHMK